MLSWQLVRLHHVKARFQRLCVCETKIPASVCMLKRDSSICVYAESLAKVDIDIPHARTFKPLILTVLYDVPPDIEAQHYFLNTTLLPSVLTTLTLYDDERVPCNSMFAYLGTTKASVGSVAGDVGPAAEALHAHIGDLVGCISMQQRPVHDGCTQVQAVAPVVVQLAFQSKHLALLGEPHLMDISKEWTP